MPILIWSFEFDNIHVVIPKQYTQPAGFCDVARVTNKRSMNQREEMEFSVKPSLIWLSYKNQNDDRMLGRDEASRRSSRRKENMSAW